MLSDAGHTVIQVGANGEESLVEDFRTDLDFKTLGRLIDDCDTAICVDSYLAHHMWANHKKAIVIFGVSDPGIFGHPENINMLKDRKYLRENQHDLYYSNQYNEEAYVKPDEVMEQLNQFN